MCAGDKKGAGLGLGTEATCAGGRQVGTVVGFLLESEIRSALETYRDSPPICPTP